MYTSLSDYAETSAINELKDLLFQVFALAHFVHAFGGITLIQLENIQKALFTESKKDFAQHLSMVNYIMGQMNDKLVEFAKKTAFDLQYKTTTKE